MSEDERECVCPPWIIADSPEQCQCQYYNWPGSENRHQSCDFCGENPVVLSVNDDAWWICQECADAHYGGEEE